MYMYYYTNIYQHDWTFQAVLLLNCIIMYNCICQVSFLPDPSLSHVAAEEMSRIAHSLENAGLDLTPDHSQANLHGNGNTQQFLNSDSQLSLNAQYNMYGAGGTNNINSNA